MDKIQKIITLESMIIHYGHACVIRTPMAVDLYKNYKIWTQYYKNGQIILCGNNMPLLSSTDVECLALLNQQQPQTPVMKMY
jgi:hypothetical protein